MHLKEALKLEAHRLGFQLVGVTTSDPPPHLDIYEAWLEAGHQAKMNWMGSDRNRERRANPKKILPECQSILVLGIAYPPSPSEPSPIGVGRVASYAWGDDYHDVLPARLKAIVAFIESQLGQAIPNRWYTDTGPILERELAQRAGLGWIGRNTCLISPRAGSYFLLAEILLGIELLPDFPITSDFCGSCTRCIEACPTQCILPNRTIDANRCISYLTIEEKGSLPENLRNLMGNWIFGCDVCQQVCPWNQRFALPTKEEHFVPHPGRNQPILMEELHLSPQSFNKKFKGSSIQRSKRRGYLRNIAVALGNSEDSEVVSSLSQVLNDNEPLVRSHSAWALGKIGGSKAKQVLLERLKTETDDLVLEEIQSALGKL
jgi:epoxyqueuosine reductase